MTTDLIEAKSKTVLVDEFLDQHGVGLPGHVVDFALDLRSVIAELEELLDRVPAGAI